MPAAPIQVYEYESIAYKGRHERSRFTQAMYESFEAYFQQNEDTPFFELIPYGVRFQQYVGAIQIGKKVIEIIPKTGRGDEDRKNIWQKALLDMLKVCHLMTPKKSGKAHLRLKSNSILDLYFELYLQELERLFHRGLFKQYRSKEGQQLSLKGALVFSRHISENIVHKERFYTRHTTYDRNHLVHQILHEALLLVQNFSASPYLQDRISRLLFDFPEVDRLQVRARHFERIPDTRKLQDYQEALQIAELILLNYRPDLMAGRNHLLALLFDMNALWEEYIYRTLQKEYGKEWHIRGQQSHYFWERQRIRPDIVLEHRKAPSRRCVIDTKWKTLDQHRPSDTDLKQMYVYNLHWDCQRSILLYPATPGNRDTGGSFRLPLPDGTEHECHLGFVEVVDNGGLRGDIAKKVIDKI